MDVFLEFARVLWKLYPDVHTLTGWALQEMLVSDHSFIHGEICAGHFPGSLLN